MHHRRIALWRQWHAGAGRSHARFEGPGVLFYASDNDDAEPISGSAHILVIEERKEAESLFERLAVGGTITTPFGLQVWGDYFGKLTDRFGVQWMINVQTSAKSS